VCVCVSVYLCVFRAHSCGLHIVQVLCVCVGGGGVGGGGGGCVCVYVCLCVCVCAKITFLKETCARVSLFPK